MLYERIGLTRKDLSDFTPLINDFNVYRDWDALMVEWIYGVNFFNAPYSIMVAFTRKTELEFLKRKSVNILILTNCMNR